MRKSHILSPYGAQYLKYFYRNNGHRHIIFCSIVYTAWNWSLHMFLFAAKIQKSIQNKTKYDIKRDLAPNLGVLLNSDQFRVYLYICLYIILYYIMLYYIILYYIILYYIILYYIILYYIILFLNTATTHQMPYDQWDH